jgi:hypothetical protein
MFGTGSLQDGWRKASQRGTFGPQRRIFTSMIQGIRNRPPSPISMFLHGADDWQDAVPDNAQDI